MPDVFQVLGDADTGKLEISVDEPVENLCTEAFCGGVVAQAVGIGLREDLSQDAPASQALLVDGPSETTSMGDVSASIEGFQALDCESFDVVNGLDCSAVMPGLMRLSPSVAECGIDSVRQLAGLVLPSRRPSPDPLPSIAWPNPPWLEPGL